MPFVPQTIAQIQQNIIAQKQSQTALSGLTSTSKTAYWNLWTFITAVGSALLQNIWAQLETEIETDVAVAVPGTPLWIQNQVLQFQDGALNGGIVAQINPNFTIGYPSANTAANIITACAVVVLPSGVVSVKVAKGTSPLGPLSSGQVGELQSYLATILPAGLQTEVISDSADLLNIDATVYYNGQYNNAIQTNVTAALNNYASLIPFNGLVKISDIEKTILEVAGVVDVVFNNITCIPAATGSTSTPLVQSKTTINRSYPTVAGYVSLSPAPTLAFSINQQ